MDETSKKPAAPCGCWACVCERRREDPMRVCPLCGNKKCPKATHHDNACPKSNEQGQPGSIYV